MAIKKDSITDFSDSDFCILGYGRFGRIALTELTRFYPTAHIRVIDCKPLKDIPENIEVITCDAVEWLARFCTSDVADTVIIPALPIHLAAEWLKKKLTEQQAEVNTIKISPDLLGVLPNPLHLKEGQIAISYADFICPSNCPEPESTCTYTGKPRPTPLYTLLQNSDVGTGKIYVIRSHQIAPGVGGFRAELLLSLLNDIHALPEANLYIGTTCKCHGIVDGLHYSLLQQGIIEKLSIAK